MLISNKFCPNCGGGDVHMIAGGTIGQWMCKKCGYIGPVLEKEYIGKNQKSEDKNG
jgi:ribosomal protein S27AE